MSFKRDGNSTSWLNLLQKRRIDELFAANIPNDEALLIKNGRFACLVCYNKPVFDTVNMLALHRNGKKHLAAKQNFISEPTRCHIGGNVKTIDGSKLQKDKSFLRKPDYDRRTRYKNVSKSLKKSIDVSESHELEMLSKEMEEKRVLLNLKPYASKCKISSPFLLHNHETDMTSAEETVCDPQPLESHQAEIKDDETKLNSTHFMNTSPLHPIMSQKEKELYLQTLQNGWKRSSAGQWIKDENVEFDSDEEPPFTQSMLCK